MRETVQYKQQGDLCEHSQHSFLAKRLFSRKEPFTREKGSGRLFLPMIRIEELCQHRSPKWVQEWCVITIKMNDNLTAQCIGTQLGRYCCKHLQNVEHEISQKSIGKTLFMKEAARQELRTVRMPQNPQLTFEQFKDILEEYQLTLS